MSRHILVMLLGFFAISLFASCRCSSTNGISGAQESIKVSASADTVLELKGIARVIVPQGAVPVGTTVSLRGEKSPDATALFDATAGAMLPTGAKKADEYVVINIGKGLSKGRLSVSLHVPADLSRGSRDQPNTRIKVFAEYVEGSDEELHDAFGEVMSIPSSDLQAVTVELSPSHFSEIHNADRTFETRLIVVAVPEDPKK